MDSEWDEIVSLFFVLNCNLDFGIRSHPLNNALLSALLQPEDQFPAQTVSQRHILFSLIGRITNHETLIAGSDLLEFLVNMHRLGNLRRLPIDSNNDSCSLVIHADGDVGVTDLFNSLSGNVFNIYLCRSADLAEYHTE